jgi:hypothetical protein
MREELILRKKLNANQSTENTVRTGGSQRLTNHFTQ